MMPRLEYAAASASPTGVPPPTVTAGADRFHVEAYPAQQVVLAAQVATMVADLAVRAPEWLDGYLEDVHQWLAAMQFSAVAAHLFCRDLAVLGQRQGSTSILAFADDLQERLPFRANAANPEHIVCACRLTETGEERLLSFAEARLEQPPATMGAGLAAVVAEGNTRLLGLVVTGGAIRFAQGWLEEEPADVDLMAWIDAPDVESLDHALQRIADWLKPIFPQMKALYRSDADYGSTASWALSPTADLTVQWGEHRFWRSGIGSAHVQVWPAGVSRDLRYPRLECLTPRAVDAIQSGRVDSWAPVAAQGNPTTLLGWIHEILCYRGMGPEFRRSVPALFELLASGTPTDRRAPTVRVLARVERAIEKHARPELSFVLFALLAECGLLKAESQSDLRDALGKRVVDAFGLDVDNEVARFLLSGLNRWAAEPWYVGEYELNAVPARFIEAVLAQRPALDGLLDLDASCSAQLRALAAIIFDVDGAQDHLEHRRQEPEPAIAAAAAAAAVAPARDLRALMGAWAKGTATLFREPPAPRRAAAGVEGRTGPARPSHGASTVARPQHRPAGPRRGVPAAGRKSAAAAAGSTAALHPLAPTPSKSKPPASRQAPSASARTTRRPNLFSVLPVDELESQASAATSALCSSLPEPKTKKATGTPRNVYFMTSDARRALMQDYVSGRRDPTVVRALLRHCPIGDVDRPRLSALDVAFLEAAQSAGHADAWAAAFLRALEQGLTDASAAVLEGLARLVTPVGSPAHSAAIGQILNRYLAWPSTGDDGPRLRLCVAAARVLADADAEKLLASLLIDHAGERPRLVEALIQALAPTILQTTFSRPEVLARIFDGDEQVIRALLFVPAAVDCPQLLLRGLLRSPGATSARGVTVLVRVCKQFPDARVDPNDLVELCAGLVSVGQGAAASTIISAQLHTNTEADLGHIQDLGKQSQSLARGLSFLFQMAGAGGIAGALRVHAPGYPLGAEAYAAMDCLAAERMRSTAINETALASVLFEHASGAAGSELRLWTNIYARYLAHAVLVCSRLGDAALDKHFDNVIAVFGDCLALHGHAACKDPDRKLLDSALSVWRLGQVACSTRLQANIQHVLVGTGPSFAAPARRVLAPELAEYPVEYTPADEAGYMIFSLPSAYIFPSTASRMAFAELSCSLPGFSPGPGTLERAFQPPEPGATDADWVVYVQAMGKAVRWGAGGALPLPVAGAPESIADRIQLLLRHALPSLRKIKAKSLRVPLKALRQAVSRQDVRGGPKLKQWIDKQFAK